MNWDMNYNYHYYTCGCTMNCSNPSYIELRQSQFQPIPFIYYKMTQKVIKCESRKPHKTKWSIRYKQIEKLPIGKNNTFYNKLQNAINTRKNSFFASCYKRLYLYKKCWIFAKEMVTGSNLEGGERLRWWPEVVGFRWYAVSCSWVQVDRT